MTLAEEADGAENDGIFLTHVESIPGDIELDLEYDQVVLDKGQSMSLTFDDGGGIEIWIGLIRDQAWQHGIDSVSGSTNTSTKPGTPIVKRTAALVTLTAAQEASTFLEESTSVDDLPLTVDLSMSAGGTAAGSVRLLDLAITSGGGAKSDSFDCASIE